MEAGVFIWFKDRKDFGGFRFAWNDVTVNYSIEKIGDACYSVV